MINVWYQTSGYDRKKKKDVWYKTRLDMIRKKRNLKDVKKKKVFDTYHTFLQVRLFLDKKNEGNWKKNMFAVNENTINKQTDVLFLIFKHLTISFFE